MMHKNIGKRVMALLLSLCMIAGMVDWSDLVVRAEGNTKRISSVEINGSFDRTYTGSPLEPGRGDITVYVQEYDENENPVGDPAPSEEYKIVESKYGTAVNAGQAGSVTVRGTGSVDGTREVTQIFVIEQRELAEASGVTIDSIPPWHGTQNVPLEPKPTLRYNNMPIDQSEYSCAYSENNQVSDSNLSGTVTITVNGTNKNYKGSMTTTFDFEKMNSENLKIELKHKGNGGVMLGVPAQNTNYLPFKNYDGTQVALDKENDVTVTYERTDGTKTPLSADEFDLVYSRQGSVTNELSKVGTVTVQARGKGNLYNGLTSTQGAEFYIRKSLQTSNIDFEIATQIFPGSKGTLDIDKKDGEEAAWGINTQMKVINPDAGPDVEGMLNSEKFSIQIPDTWKQLRPDENGEIHITATVTAELGKGYFGFKDVPVIIKATELSKKMVTIEPTEEIMYDGTTDWLQRIIDQGWVKVGDYVQGPTGDYTVKKANSSQTAIAQGTYDRALVVERVEGGQLTGGPVYISVTVKKRPVTDKEFKVNVIGTCTYNGKRQEPKIEVTYKGSALNSTDYVATPGTNIDAGTDAGSYEITGKGNFEGKTTVRFNILPFELRDDNVNILEPTGKEEFEYNGRPQSPNVNIIVTMGDNSTYKLGSKSSEDYTTSYEDSKGNPSNHTDATEDGDAITMIITAGGNFTGEFQRNFTIKPQKITTANITAELDKSYTYTGASIHPQPRNVRHLRGLPFTEADYRVDWGENTKPGIQAGRVDIIGQRNYTGTVPFYFDIAKCDLSDENVDLKVTAYGPSNETYDFVHGTIDGIEGELFYPYEGKAIKLEEKNLQVSYGMNNMILGDDYTVSYTKNDSIGPATITITGQGDNYEKSRTFEFRIKGDLTPLNQLNSGGRAEASNDVDQIYNAGVITPTGTVVKFHLDNGEVLPLEEGKDFTVANRDTGKVTQCGTAYATITGINDYTGGGDIEFNVIPLNLQEQEKDLAEKHKYMIEGISADPYVYSGLPITPEPTITHNGTGPLTSNEYGLKYYRTKEDGTEEEIADVNTDPFDVGSYRVAIEGKGPNYEGATQELQPYTIRKYNIKEDGKYGQTDARIRLEGKADSVVLDQVKYPEEYENNPYDGPAEMKKLEGGEATDQVVWKDLKVWYTPVDMEGNPVTDQEKALTLGVDYTIEYKDNEKPGTASYTITGIGNFDGEITEEFQILADLGGSRTTVTAPDVDFTPAGEDGIATNTPEPVLVYKVTIGGREQEVPLVKDVDYTVSYDHNEKATMAPEGKDDMVELPELTEDNTPIAIVTAVTAPPTDADTPKSKAFGENRAAFGIRQRDLENQENDELLAVSGLLEEGYRFDGSPIVPDIKILCNQIALVREGEAAEYDYSITAKYNTHVWEFEEGVRMKPEATVFARKTEEGKYNGNYYGEFKVEFVINPREISEATIDSIVKIVNESSLVTEVNGEWECNYTRGEIRFPAADDPTKNALKIVWSEGEGENEIRTPLIEDQDYKITYQDNIAIGEATVHIEAPEISDYTGFYDKHFKIMASIEEVDNPNPEEGRRYMELTYNDKVPYGVVDVFPDLKFEDKSGVFAGASSVPKILEEGVDFVIVTKDNYQELGETTYSQNNSEITTEGNKATVIIKGQGFYRGTIKGEFTREYDIVPKDFSVENSGLSVRFIGSRNDLEGYENAYIYNGQEQRPTIEVYNNNPKDLEKEDYVPHEHPLLKLGPDDYEVVDYINNTELSTDTVKAGVIVRGKGPKYTGETTFWFTIIPKPMEDVTCQITESSIIYDGTAKEPAISVYYTENGQRIALEPDKDYVVSYENNVEAKASNAEEPPKIILEGIGGYGGKLTVPFTIGQKNINSPDIQANGFAPYKNGDPVTPAITIKDNGVPAEIALLAEEKDYLIVNQSSDVEMGKTGTVTVQGQNNYTGTRTVEFRIIPPNGTFEIEPITESYMYDGRVIEPKVTVNLLSEDGEQSYPLTEGVDYDLSYSEQQNVGTATVMAVGKDIFLGKQATATYAIIPRIIGTDGVADTAFELKDIKDYQYTGNAITPVVELIFTPPSRVNDQGEEEAGKPAPLVLGRDYTVTAVNNVTVGVATATITGIGNYSGTITKDFRILGNMNMVSVAPIPNQDYTGSAVTPVPVVTLGDRTLTLGTDYSIEYKDNVDRGTASIIITGTPPWFTGSKTVNFDIARELSSETSIRGVAASYTYTGAAIAPPVRVEDDGNLLKNGVDYEVTYSENVNAGTATIVIKGIGKYTGSTSTSFKISPQQLGRAKVSQVSDRIYDGKEQNPPITVTSGDKTLENGKDYTLVYVNSATPGMASVIVKGEGNYTGTQTVNYRISVPSLTGVKFSKSTDKTVTISWTKNSVVTGYEIYNSKNRRAVRVSKASTTQGTVKKLKAGTAATFRVRAYVNKDGQYYYGPFTSVKTVTAPSATKITSLTSKKAKQAVVKWKKVSGATQYEVYRSTSKKGKYKKIATTKKTSYTDKKATGGKKYFYKIRVCKKISKKNYYSSYSAVKSVKAKK